MIDEAKIAFEEALNIQKKRDQILIDLEMQSWIIDCLCKGASPEIIKVALSLL